MTVLLTQCKVDLPADECSFSNMVSLKLDTLAHTPMALASRATDFGQDQCLITTVMIMTQIMSNEKNYGHPLLPFFFKG